MTKETSGHVGYGCVDEFGCRGDPLCFDLYEVSRGAQLYRVVYMVRMLMNFQRNRSRRRLKKPLIEQLRDTICGQAMAFHRCDAQILFFVATQDLMSNHPQRPPYCVACRHAKPQQPQFGPKTRVSWA